jgi:hypothetical protein
MYLKHRLTKVCILRQIALVTSHVSHPYKSTDFTQALKILILVSFLIDVNSHTFLSFENDSLAFCIHALTSVLALPSLATISMKQILTLHICSALQEHHYKKNYFLLHFIFKIKVQPLHACS